MLEDKKTAAVVLLVIVLGAIGIRLYGLGWGLPFHFHSDESLLANYTERLRTASSAAELVRQERRFFIYPPLLMYPTIALVSASTLIRPMSYDDSASLKLFYLLGRGIVALLGAATVILLYLLGKRLYSRTAGVFAAFILAFSVIHVRDSHFYCTDVPLAFFLALILYLGLDIVEKRTMKAYLLAGAVTGLAFAAKQTALLMVPVLGVAHLLALWKEGSLSLKDKMRFLFSRRSLGRLFLMFGIMAVAFLVADPFVLMSPANFLAESSRISSYLSGAQQPQWTFQFTGTTIGYWVTNLLFYGMGPFLEIVCLLGVLWALAKRKRADGLVLTFLFVYIALICTGPIKYIRYAIPLLPFLALLGARFMAELYGAARRRTARLAVVALLAVVGLTSILYSIAYLNVYRQEDVRIQASRWIHETIPKESTVLINISYATPLFGEMFFRPGFFDSYTVGFGNDTYVKKDYYTIKTLNLFTYASQSLNPPEKFRKYIQERMENVDYIIMSDEHSEQFSFRPRQYPAVVQFFNRLYAEQLDFKLVKTFVVTPSIFGIAIPDGGAELTFRLFDHPKVRIFKRNPPGAEPAAASFPRS